MCYKLQEFVEPKKACGQSAVEVIYWYYQKKAPNVKTPSHYQCLPYCSIKIKCFLSAGESCGMHGRRIMRNAP